MPIAHECKCGLVTPVPESQGGKRIRCKGCGTIALVTCPEVLDPDPVPVAAGNTPADTAPPPPPRKPHKYRRPLTREEERADYPRTGGVIDWRQVYEGDEDDYHRDPIPPDPQTRYLNPPDPGLPWKVAWGVTGGGVCLAGAGVVVIDLLSGGPSCFSLVGLALLLVGGGLAMRGFRRRY